METIFIISTVILLALIAYLFIKIDGYKKDADRSAAFTMDLIKRSDKNIKKCEKNVKGLRPDIASNISDLFESLPDPSQEIAILKKELRSAINDVATLTAQVAVLLSQAPVVVKQPTPAVENRPEGVLVGDTRPVEERQYTQPGQDDHYEAPSLIKREMGEEHKGKV